MPSLGIPARILASIIVERTRVLIPTGITSSVLECEEDPVDCCPCCEPMPPEILWITIETEDEPCECIPLCIQLTYSSLSDAWYSEPIGDCEEPEAYFRLKCVNSTWTFVLVTNAGVLWTGVIRDGGICDPFTLVVDFNDQGGTTTVCDGSFVASIGEEDCNPSEIQTDCCDNTIPSTIYATWVVSPGDPLDCADDSTITLQWNADTNKWEGTDAFGTCGWDVTLKFYCVVGGTDCTGFRLDVSMSNGCSTFNEWSTMALDCTCDPLLVVFESLGSQLGVCGTLAVDIDLIISETAP